MPAPATASEPAAAQPAALKLDLREHGGPRAGRPQALDRRLFMQLLAYTGAPDWRPLAAAVAQADLPAVLYADVNDPRGVALLSWSEDSDFFVRRLRPFLAAAPFARLAPKPEFTMLGRSYALGHEPDLADWLIEKPRRAVSNPAWPWAVWYPLRRRGPFSLLTPDEAAPILREHGRIGHAFGSAGYAQDIRLACFGLDRRDSDFVIGLVGDRLHPLSACVEAMRKTRQTSQYIARMGPFLVGKAVYQPPIADPASPTPFTGSAARGNAAPAAG
ncbi:MAG: chlorite dismutase family protein [Terriglobales bacterium]